MAERPILTGPHQSVPGPYESRVSRSDSPLGRDIAAVLAARGAHQQVSAQHLTEACKLPGVVLGAYDRRIVDWLAGYEPQVVQVVIGLISRAYAAGHHAAEYELCPRCGVELTVEVRAGIEVSDSGHGWYVARDAGPDCVRCDRQVQRGQAVELMPGSMTDIEHVHCPDPDPLRTAVEALPRTTEEMYAWFGEHGLNRSCGPGNILLAVRADLRKAARLDVGGVLDA